MATMYELLSSRPSKVPGQKGSFTAQWDEDDIKSREYMLPVRRNQRNKIHRPIKQKQKDAEIAEEKQVDIKPEKKTKQGFKKSHWKKVSGLIKLNKVRLAGQRKRDATESDEEEYEDYDDEEMMESYETRSISSSVLRPEPPPEVSSDAVERVKSFYDKHCEKVKVIPMSLFIRQLGTPTIDLHFNTVGDNGIKAMAVPIAMCPALVKVNLNTTNIGDHGVAYLMEALMDNEELKDLDLSNNKITAAGGKYICDYIEQSKTIRTLTLSGNQLGDTFANHLAEALQRSLGLLGTLRVSDCGFGEEAGRTLGPAIGMNDTVTELDLSWNHIRLSGAAALVQGITVNDTLQTVDLSWNGFSMEGAEAMNRMLAQNNNLTELDLTNNRFGDKAILKLLNGLKVNTSLQVLKIGKNPMSPLSAAGLLKAERDNPSTALRRLELQDVPVKDEFFNALSELRENNPDFQIVHANQTDTNVRKSAIDTLFEYLEENNTSLKDIFGITDAIAGPMWINKVVFIDQFKEAGTPLAEYQIIEIANIAERKDGTVVNIGYLFQRWEQYQAEHTS